MELENIMLGLEKRIEEDEYKGYESYEAAQRLPKIIPYKYRMYAFRDYPAPFFMVRLFGRKQLYADVVAFMLFGYVANYKRTGDKVYLEKSRKAADMLLEDAIKVDKTLGWGFHFAYTDSVLRKGDYVQEEIPAGTPCSYDTGMALHSLMDYYGISKDKDILAAIRKGCDYLLKHHGHKEFDDGSLYLHFNRGDGVLVNNVNSLSSSALIRASKILKNKRYASFASKILKRLLQNQNPDGSWWYCYSPRREVVDGCHTGFLLYGLIHSARETKNPRISHALRIGLRYYREHLFYQDGSPKLVYDRDLPLYTMGGAWGMIVFSMAGDRHFAKRVADATVRLFYNARTGFFHDSLRPKFKVRLPYIRWSTAPMYQAISTLLSHGGQRNG
jgi:hypothetical protein